MACVVMMCRLFFFFGGGGGGFCILRGGKFNKLKHLRVVWCKKFFGGVKITLVTRVD